VRTSQRAIEQAIAVLEREDRNRHELLSVLRGYLATSKEIPPALRLSKRQTMTLELVAEGLSNAEIARRLEISPATVKRYASDLLAKLHARGRAELAVKVLRLAS
jgi:DNA-binding NarL/FixJ family response regulator